MVGGLDFVLKVDIFRQHQFQYDGVLISSLVRHYLSNADHFLLEEAGLELFQLWIIFGFGALFAADVRFS